MSFTNLYYKRTAGTPKACFVCYRPTPIVLATAQTVDFLYTCESHLKDPGFASRITDDPLSKSGLTVEEIAQVKADWEDKQKRKAEKEKEKKEGDKGKAEGKDGEKPKEDSSKGETTKVAPSKVTSPAPAPTPQQPSHEKYALHRDMFALRTAEHRRRRQAAQAKELAPRLPGAPRSAVN